MVPKILAASLTSLMPAAAAKACFSNLFMESKDFPVAATESCNIRILSSSLAVRRSMLLSCVPKTALSFPAASAAPSKVSN